MIERENMCSGIKEYRLGDAPITVMSYDLNTASDPNINSMFKDWLIGHGWYNDIHGMTVKRFNISDTYETREMPATTLWKEGIIHVEAVKEFACCAEVYWDNNVENSLIAYGKVIAFCGNTYAALSLK